MSEIVLPDLIYLEDFYGDYAAFIDAVYEIFKNDFVESKPKFRGKRLALKSYPIYQDRPYTFYHMTHSGDDEQNRTPDIRRCERIPYARPVIENCDKWSLKIWSQKRGTSDRLCIWLERENEPDYFVILDVRKNYILPWTAFVAQYPHEKKKKEKEYQDFLKRQRPPGSKS
jgi:hypothetical protein